MPSKKNTEHETWESRLDEDEERECEGILMGWAMVEHGCGSMRIRQMN